MPKERDANVLIDVVNSIGNTVYQQTISFKTMIQFLVLEGGVYYESKA